MTNEELNVFGQLLRKAVEVYPEHAEFYAARAKEVEIQYLNGIKEAIDTKIKELTGDE